MSLPVVLTAEAAADWYEEQANRGARFTAEVRAALNHIGQMPELHAILHRDVRRAQVKKSPYHIYYRVRADRVEILAVLHGRRDPSLWRGRA